MVLYWNKGFPRGKSPFTRICHVILALLAVFGGCTGGFWRLANLRTVIKIKIKN
jgi:hypothetical protein